jgi:hypothetical protein
MIDLGLRQRIGGYDNGCTYNCFHYANRSMPYDLMKFGVTCTDPIGQSQHANALQ